MPKASDQTLVTKILRAHGGHARLVVPKFSGTLIFGVRHFAGIVSYNCSGFLEKNADRLPSNEAVDWVMDRNLVS